MTAWLITTSTRSKRPALFALLAAPNAASSRRSLRLCARFATLGTRTSKVFASRYQDACVSRCMVDASSATLLGATTPLMLENARSAPRDARYVPPIPTVRHVAQGTTGPARSIQMQRWSSSRNLSARHATPMEWSGALLADLIRAGTPVPPIW
jgi:hypothetical protein